MADFVAVLKKAIDGLGDATPEVREKVYQKARLTIGAKLSALNPPPPPAVADRQRKALEDAIKQIEASYAPKPPPPADPLAELDALFAELTPKEKTSSAPAHAPADAKPAAIQPTKPGEAKGAPVSAPPPATPVSSASSKVAARPSPQPASPEPRAPEASMRAEAQPPEALAPVSRPVDDLPDFDRPLPPRSRTRPGMGLWLAVVAVLLILAGAGYGLFLNKDSFLALLDSGTQVARVDPAAGDKPAAAAPDPAPAEEEEAAAQTETPAPAAGQPSAGNGAKFTQRLNPDGSEIDAGRAGGAPSVGEGTSLAQATLPPAEGDAGAATDESPTAGTGAEGAGTPAPAPAEPAIPVGQKAIFYEERTSVAEGSADTGSIVWTVVQEAPGADLPAEPVIRGEASIPAKGLQLRMTIRRNSDQTLPASHIVELIFLTPDDFASGPIDNVLRMTMKDTEQAAGSPLFGIPAKIADGFFLVALSDSEREVQANIQLMQRQRWIDVPIVYKSGRRALITMEKGLPGEKIFDEAIKAWQAASSG